MTRLLATDMDGTFIGDDEAMHALWDAVDQSDITLAFSTGRHLRSIQDFYEEKQADKRAAACVCMVGTDIHVRKDGAYELIEEWHRVISENWDKAKVEQILQSIPEATMQDQQWQSPFKSSYFLEENIEQRLKEIRDGLSGAGLQAKVVHSAGRFLDLLPIKSGKGEAVKFLAQKLNVPPDAVITAGDTGNDLDMMRPELGFRCIAVGNAAPELKAFEGPQVYHAQADFAAGIHEGLRHYGWLA
jgi:sucrose-6F-phosphate phosphohydrolase